MERLTCDYCGLPFRAPYKPPAGEKAFCCSGCALASKLGIEGETFPVSPQLIFDLALAFGVFNQLLLVLLVAALRRDGRFDGAALCVTISAALGGALYLTALGWQWRSRWLRATDAFLYAALAAPVLGGVTVALWLKRADAALVAAVANLLLVVWQGRGFLRRLWARKRVR
ncbi:MAG TPA: hypothetical protein VK163_04850 [Opitutaceae bacterium]|nr:hypothetical protein [Opitutaceae bacterium]